MEGNEESRSPFPGKRDDPHEEFFSATDGFDNTAGLDIDLEDGDGMPTVPPEDNPQEDSGIGEPEPVSAAPKDKPDEPEEVDIADAWQADAEQYIADSTAEKEYEAEADDDADRYGMPYPEAEDSAAEEADDSDDASEKAPFNLGDEENEEMDEASGGEDEEESEQKASFAESVKNEAPFLNRGKITLCILGAAGVFVLFFTVLLPMLRPSTGKKKTAETFEQAGKESLPRELAEMLPDGTYMEEEDENEPAGAGDYTDYAEKFPPPVTIPSSTKSVEIVTTPAQSSYVNEREPSNASVQQQAFQDVELSDTASSARVKSILATGEQQRLMQKAAQADANKYNPYRSASGGTSTSSAESSLVGLYAALLNNKDGSSTKMSYTQMNDQQGKIDFQRNTNSGAAGNYKYNSESSLWKGTIIPLVLETAINTDLPGTVIATVTENVYSSGGGKYLLIPQGSKVFAIYNSSVSYAQERVQVAWNTLIRPDGLEIDLGSLEGISADGSSGVKGWKTDHPFEHAKAFGLIAAYSLITTKMQMYYRKRNMGNYYVDNLKEALTDPVMDYANERVDNLLQIQPTITVPSGSRIDMITAVSMDIPPLVAEAPTRKFVRKH